MKKQLPTVIMDGEKFKVLKLNKSRGKLNKNCKFLPKKGKIGFGKHIYKKGKQHIDVYDENGHKIDFIPKYITILPTRIKGCSRVSIIDLKQKVIIPIPKNMISLFTKKEKLPIMITYKDEGWKPVSKEMNKILRKHFLSEQKKGKILDTKEKKKKALKQMFQKYPGLKEVLKNDTKRC